MPRANLNRDVILEAAAALADRIGYDQLSMAAIAHQFGVRVPSLYKHVPSLPAVRCELAAQALGELAMAMRAAASAHEDCPAALLELAHAYRRYAQAHPGLYSAIVRAPDPSDAAIAARSAEVLQVVYGVLAQYGRPQEEMVHDVRTLRAALHGFVSLEAGGGFGMPVDIDQSFVRMVGILDAAFRQSRL